MARRLVSGAKEAMTGLRIAPTGYEKIGSNAAIRSQKERAGRDARLIAQQVEVRAERRGSTSNHWPDGAATKMIGALHGCGRSTVPWMWESPVELAKAVPVETFTTPVGVRQLTVALNRPTGFLPLTGGTTMMSPLTVTSTVPSWPTVPEPLEITHGRPPPLMPRSLI